MFSSGLYGFKVRNLCSGQEHGDLWISLKTWRGITSNIPRMLKRKKKEKKVSPKVKVVVQHENHRKSKSMLCALIQFVLTRLTIWYILLETAKESYQRMLVSPQLPVGYTVLWCYYCQTNQISQYKTKPFNTSYHCNSPIPRWSTRTINYGKNHRSEKDRSYKKRKKEKKKKRIWIN